MQKWPDQAVATDSDENGRTEVVAVSTRRRFLAVWDDDGKTLWKMHNSTHVEGLLGVRNIVSGPTQELLTHPHVVTGLGRAETGCSWSDVPTRRTSHKV